MVLTGQTLSLMVTGVDAGRMILRITKIRMPAEIISIGIKY